MMHLRLRSLLPEWLAGALCLLLPAFFNGFPLVSSDSGSYISNAYTLYVPIDRPVGYSVIIRLASLGATLWGVVAAQALVICALMLLLARHLLGSAYNRWIFIAIMLLLGTATSAGWTVAQLTPDVYTPLMLLSLCVLLFVPVSGAGKWLLYVLILGCMLVHNSNVLIGAALALLLLLYAWMKRNVHLKRTGLALLGIGVIGWLMLSAMNAIAERGFRPSPATHVFIMSRMVENGIARAYLNEHCATERFTLCEDREQLAGMRQWDFMWNEGSPLYKAGGWQATEGEYTRIIRGTLTEPKYLMMHITKNVRGTIEQLLLLKLGDELAPFGRGSSPHWAIGQYYPQELKAFAAARQQSEQLHLSRWNVVIVAVSVCLCIAALAASVWRKGKQPMIGMLLFMLAAILINAAVTSTFATVVGRYETRVFWILPFLATLQLIRSYYAGRIRE